MISYDLARELKDAGYPFPKPIEGDEFWYLPTLEELIEACGISFLKLERGTRQTGEREISDCWTVMGLIAEPHEYNAYTEATPTEAVARLWLALNRP
jgi:hypothetical protein